LIAERLDIPARSPNARFIRDAIRGFLFLFFQFTTESGERLAYVLCKFFILDGLIGASDKPACTGDVINDQFLLGEDIFFVSILMSCQIKFDGSL